MRKKKDSIKFNNIDMKKLEKAMLDDMKNNNFKNKRPPIMIPSVWSKTVPNKKKQKELEEEYKEAELIDFMQDCRERTADMKDDEKCKKCKLRFRCYTERKTKVYDAELSRPIRKIISSRTPLSYKGKLFHDKIANDSKSNSKKES